MKKFVLPVLALISISCMAQRKDPTVTEVWDIKPPVITPGKNAGEPPSDAIILFDGKNLDAWTTLDGKAAEWEVKDGAVTVVLGKGDIKTKQVFGDMQLHIEWRSPAEISGQSQSRGNSGIFLQERYEIQVLDSYENETYPNGQAGSVYKQHTPLVNAARKPGEWQSYDIIYTAPRFGESGRVISPARVTILHNGVLIQNNAEIWGPTEYIGLPVYKAHGKAALQLQDHRDGKVSYRNIWVREL
ncbi:MAG TPA: DUF1080 domain-containing protein [Cyclobacteriaceae bacterium]|nr:DUF1080 domain-containing protein [Cyclobacteriaceae bacterium]